MHTIAVVSRKGGVGKTTIAVNLTLWAAASGCKALLADADPLRSAGQVLRLGPREASPLVETSARKLYALRNASAAAGLELMVVDTAPTVSSDIAEAVRVANLTLVVSRPSYLDIAAAVETAFAVQRLGQPYLIVLNHCPVGRGGVEPPVVVQALRALTEVRLPVAPILLRQRAAYQASLARGQSVFQFAAESAAAREANGLFSHLFDCVSHTKAKAA